jgi:hypothetical protein
MVVTERGLSRWMGALGLGILVLLVVGFGVLGSSQPKENASGIAVNAYFNAHVAKAWAQVYVIGLALGGLVLYVSRLRVELFGDGEGNRTLANASFLGGTLLIMGVLVGGVFAVALILAAHNHQGGIAQTLNFVGQNDEIGFVFGMAVFALSTGAAILGQTRLPRWLGVVWIVVGVVTVAGPFGFFGFALGGVWIAVTGFVIAAKARGATREVAPSASGIPIGS